jgi:diguanylate cyclase (GGDEF)-like protein
MTDRLDVTAVFPAFSGDTSATGSRAPERPFLMILAGPDTGEIFPIEHGDLIGRDRDCAVRLRAPAVSRQHARLCFVGDDLFIEDLGSTNGTVVNGQAVASRRELRDGDRVTIGVVTLLKLSSDVVDREVFRARLVELGTRDPVTRLLTINLGLDRLEAELAFARRHGGPLAILVADVDEMHLINQVRGEACGDEALALVAGRIKANLRREDLAARYREDSFLIVARGTDVQGASRIAERLQRDVASTVSVVEGIPVTICVGIASVPPVAPQTMQDLLACAELALLDAKVAGRNRVKAHAPRGGALSELQRRP